MLDARYDIITVGGLPGSGTSTVCSLLVEETSWHYANAGDIFREMATERGLSLAEFGELAEENPEIDKQLDARMVQIARELPNTLLEGRLVGWMAHRFGLHACKVWLSADAHTRGQRCSARDGTPLVETERAMAERERSEASRYLDHHDIDITDCSIYDLIIDTGLAKPQAVAAQILDAVREVK